MTATEKALEDLRHYTAEGRRDTREGVPATPREAALAALMVAFRADDSLADAADDVVQAWIGACEAEGRPLYRISHSREHEHPHSGNCFEKVDSP